MEIQLNILAKEIIDLSDSIITSNSSPNLEIIKLIKREFIMQYKSLIESEKVVVLNRRKDLWASRIITDSANYEYDKILFNKVFEFNRLCKKLPMKDLNILYNY